MDTLESIVADIDSLPVAQGDRRLATRLCLDRAYLALSPAGRPELFFRGSRESFEGVRLSRSLSWGEYKIAETDELLPALVVQTAASESGRRIMAHVAYEARRCLETDPGITNAELILNLRAFLELVLRNQTLSPDEQIGLIGELQFLHELVSEGAATPAERAEAVGSWCGAKPSLRDFQNASTSVEVKASSSGTRHHVSMDQLLLGRGEGTLMLCSVRVRRDASAPLKLPDKIRLLEEAIADADVISQFREKLGGYGSVGYGAEDRRLYELESGFFIERSVLRKIDDSTAILRASSFRDGEPPANISDIRYAIDVQAIPTVSPDVRGRVFADLIGRRYQQT